jgi:Carboxypeptidase regulatory-like domain
MRSKTSSGLVVLIAVVSLLLSSLLLVANVFAQETTGGLQGTVKDGTGAVVPSAHVEVTGTSLAGNKALDTDSAGYYRFANLPPGTYVIAVSARGFKTVKREGVTIEVGHLPTVDLTLEVGAAAEVVEVSGAAPVIDVTTNTNQTNITQDVLANTPHGYSFQSVIQFSPMARNEPLMGGSAGMTGNAGGSPPGSAGNGGAVGFSVGGGSDSENQYLVEGQDTENISGGASNANVPFQFIQEVQVKSSGIEAEHGGALGGVVNVVMKKGQNAYHGSFFGTYEGDSLNGSPNAALRYDPLGTPFGATSNGPGFDDDAQIYQPKRDHYRIAQTGFTIGGPIMKDRLFFFLGFAPQYNSLARAVDFSGTVNPTNKPLGLGIQHFTQDQQTYFSTARLDAVLTQKIRVFGSWLYQYQRENGDSLPTPDSTAGFPNTGINIGGTNFSGINSPITQYSHGLGFSSPNATYNVGADITLTPKIVATTRYGYFFSNYHDFGWPTSGVDITWQTTGTGAGGNCLKADYPACNGPNDSRPLPANLALPSGTSTAPFDANFTEVNASKHYQFNQDVAFFKSGWWGTHNIKAGYQFNKLSNVINQHGNVPSPFVRPGAGLSYQPSTTTGRDNCAILEAEWVNPATGAGVCASQYGYGVVADFATVLKNAAGVPVPATDHNHALFVQDAWTIGHGLTLNLGVRIEKETLPAPPGIGISSIRTINFAWSDKIAPRLGAAWGSRDGKMKIFGSYGVTNDVMKLLLAQTSFGAQGGEDCWYALGPNSTGGFNNSDLSLTFVNGRACPTGISTVGANFVGGTTPVSLTDPSGVSLLENLNFRPEEPVMPGLKPYRQHEIVAGWDYQINKNWALEARYDRRRLDHVIEDASLADPNAFEIYNVVNPGQGVNKTLNGYASYLTSIGDAYGPGTAAFNPSGAFGTCTGCPNNPQAVRNYDGLELRLTKMQSRGFSGMFSYTWSRLWGNYAGLTTTDQTDSVGRNSPDTSRSFDEPFFYFGANGKSSDGPLPTDRPNAFKGYAYYALPWMGGLRNNTTTFGLFQVAYSGSPMSAFGDVGAGIGNGAATPAVLEGTYIFGRGNWVNTTQDASGNITLGTPYARRTPWFTQTDFNLQHSIKVNKNNEAQVLSFNATFTNLLNQHAVTSYWEAFNSNYLGSTLLPPGSGCGPGGATGPCSIFSGASFYQAAETGYNAQATVTADGIVKNGLYGQPNLWQISRHIRLGATFTW